MKSNAERCKQLLSKLNWLPPLLTRIVLGVIFIESGWGKLHDIEKVVAYFTELGIPFPGAQAHFVAATELVAGVMVLTGLMARLASIPLIAIMTVAIITAKAADISTFSDIFGFSEFLYILLLGWLVITGPGFVSLDQFVTKRKNFAKPVLFL